MDLNAWFGKAQVLKEINIKRGRQCSDRRDRSLRLRQVHLHPLPEPHA